MRVSVFNSRELQGVIVSMKAMPRELAVQLRRATQAVAQPEWQKALDREASTDLERRVLSSTGRTQVSNQNVTLRSAGVGKTLSGGAKPAEVIGGAEWGANREKTKTYQATSSKGRTFQVKNRHTQRQFITRRKGGYVAYPAAARIIPRLASLWVQTTVRTFYEALERR